MNGYSFVKAVAVVCVPSLAALTFAAPLQDFEVGQSGAARPTPAAVPVTPSSIFAVPADGGPLQSWSPEAARQAADRSIDRPVVHRGIPGELVVDGVYAEPTLSGQTVLRDVSTGTRPVLPVDAPPAAAGYLSGCPCNFGTFENEPDCGIGNGLCDANSDTTNGGCNMAVPAFSPIALGETYCGTAYYNGACRDTDWYQFTLTQATRVTWRVTAEFDVQINLIGNGTGNCPLPTVVFDTGAACGETSISATLGAGTWVAFVAADFSGPTFACGAQYTATLERSCEVTFNEAAFDAENPGLTVEDFEDGNAPAGSFCGSHPTPWTSATVNSCLNAGDIAPGLAMDNQDGVPNAFLLGVGYAGGGQALDNQGYLGESSFQADMVFSPTVTRVGLEIEHAIAGAASATIQVYGPGLVLYDTIVAPIANSVETFVGITCAEPIAQVRVLGNANAPTIMSVAYGNKGEGCEVILSESEYDARFPNQTLEDFEDSNVAPGNIVTCGTDPVTSAGDGGTCFDPGDIVAGLSIGSQDASSIVALGAGVNGYASKHVGANFNVPTVATFAGGVRQCGLRLVPTPSATTFTVDAYDPGGGLMASFPVSVASAASGDRSSGSPAMGA